MILYGKQSNDIIDKVYIYIIECKGTVLVLYNQI